MILQNLDSVDSCRYCGSSNIQTVQLPYENPHYAELKCKNCSRHLKWVAEPLEELETIEMLLIDSRLTSWECKFLSKISKYTRLSFSQKFELQSIEERLRILDKIPDWD